MNGYTYPPHQLSPQHQQQQLHQSPTAANQNQAPHGGIGINPAMLQGAHAAPHLPTQAQMQGMNQAQLLARQQMLNNMGGLGNMSGMSGMNGLGNMAGMGGGMNNMAGMSMPNGAMNIPMNNNRMNNMAGMNMPGMGGMNNLGMNSLAGMNNMDLFKSNNMGGASAGGMNMGMDGGMTINPAMLASASNNGAMNSGAGMSAQDLQKMMAGRQAAMNMGGMNAMNNMNSMAGMGGLGSMNGMSGMNMNMGMNMMSGTQQQQALMQQYLAQQQAQQQQQQQQAQSQSHSPQSSTHTPASASGGNPYPPFPSQSHPQSQSQQMQMQMQMQMQNANINAMPPPPPRPNTAMSGSSQHAMGMGIGRPPSTMHHQQQQAVLHNQQQVQMGHGSISRPGTAAGFRPSSSAGDAPRTPHTPQLSNQQSQGLNILQNTGQNQNVGQSQHVHEAASLTPSRPQTAASNHGAAQAGMNGKYPLGMGGMGVGMNNMGMGNMSGMSGMNLMGGAGGGMMPPPSLPRQNSIGPSSQNQQSMQPQSQNMQAQQQMQHHQQQNMMSAHGHGSPLSASGPASAGLTRSSSIGDGLAGMGAVMGGAGVDDPMGNISGMNHGLGMGSGLPSGMGVGMGMGIGIGGVGVGGMGVGGSMGGMSQMQQQQRQEMQHMQEMQQRRAITLAEFQKQQAARQGQTGGPSSVVPSPGASISSAGVGMNAGATGGDVQGMSMAQGQTNQMPMPGAGMNVDMTAMGTPTRASASGRTSMPPPGSSAMSVGGMAGMPGSSSGTSASTVAPTAPSTSGSSVLSHLNGAVAPAPAANATATTSAAAPNSAQSALAASLPPLPAGVQLNPTTTRITTIPLSESANRIPPISQEDIDKVAGWLAVDRAYEQRFRGMVARAKAELAVGPASVQRPRWWERDTNPATAAAVAAAAARRGKAEKFDLIYPHGTSQNREMAAAAARRKGRRKEGLKIPGRLKTAEAERGEQLVPIRLEFDVEHHKYRDTFVWNLNDPIVTPEAFAQSLIDDYGLSTSYHSTITKSIQEQLSDYKAHTATLADVSNDVDMYSGGETKASPIRGLLEDESEDAKWWATWRSRLRMKDGTVRKKALLKEVAAAVAKNERARKRKRSAQEHKSAAPAEETRPPPTVQDGSGDVEMREMDEDDMHEEMRIVIKLDVTVGEMKLDDQFEWDIENLDPTPEQFAEVYCIDLGLAGEFKTAIAHSIREQVTTYQKSLFLVGHPSDGSAVQDDDLRMSFLPSVTSGPRSVDQTQAHQPIINYLSDGELDRLDKDREKEANKRRKRNTRGRRGIALPDREPIRTHRTPAIGFPEIDPSTLAIAAAAAAPTSRRAAAAAASLTIANMVASENGTTVLPPVSTTPSAPQLPTSKVPKPRGSFKAPSYPSSILKPRANVTSPIPSTVVDSATFQPPIEGDAPLPMSAPATPSAPLSKAANMPMTARRQRELEKEAKEREFADGQRANMINGVWHCSNCGCPDSVAIGRRKGPLGDKSQCGACGKFWHRHRRPRPVEYHTEPEYHLNLKMESERAKASAKKRGGAAALRALNLQHSQDQAATPASATDDPSSPPVPKREVWVEIPSPRKSARASPAPADVLDLLDRPLSPASDVSSSASEKPLAQSVGQPNGTASASRPASSAATPSKATSEPPAPPEVSIPVPDSWSPKSKPAPALANNNSGSSEPRAVSTPVQDRSSVEGSQPPQPARPQWHETAIAEILTRYPDDRIDFILRKQIGDNPPEWRVKCLDCPGKLYTPGPGESLTNFEVHLKNRQHRAKVQARLNSGAT